MSGIIASPFSLFSSPVVCRWVRLSLSTILDGSRPSNCGAVVRPPCFERSTAPSRKPHRTYFPRLLWKNCSRKQTCIVHIHDEFALLFLVEYKRNIYYYNYRFVVHNFLEKYFIWMVNELLFLKLWIAFVCWFAWREYVVNTIVE